MVSRVFHYSRQCQKAWAHSVFIPRRRRRRWVIRQRVPWTTTRCRWHFWMRKASSLTRRALVQAVSPLLNASVMHFPVFVVSHEKSTGIRLFVFIFFYFLRSVNSNVFPHARRISIAVRMRKAYRHILSFWFDRFASRSRKRYCNFSCLGSFFSCCLLLQELFVNVPALYKFFSYFSDEIFAPRS